MFIFVLVLCSVVFDNVWLDFPCNEIKAEGNGHIKLLLTCLDKSIYTWFVYQHCWPRGVFQLVKGSLKYTVSVMDLVDPQSPEYRLFTSFYPISKHLRNCLKVRTSGLTSCYWIIISHFKIMKSTQDQVMIWHLSGTKSVPDICDDPLPDPVLFRWQWVRRF